MAKKAVKKTTKKSKAIQPEVNIGLIGHVDHGKTTLVRALSGKWTDTHSEEIKRGITIRLGYADVTIYKCGDTYTITDKCDDGEAVLQRKVSLIDAPGHESLMATMLCGANIIDGAILLISANEECPQPQTREHLQALEIIGLDKIIIVQNKIDLVSEEKSMKNYEQIKEFLKGTKFENAPIIPMSAKHSVNLDVLLQTIQDIIPTPKRDLTKEPLMFVARSFDVAKPGAKPKDLTGGILGGSLKQGKIELGKEIEILPGYEVEEKNQKIWKPLRTKVTSMITGGDKVDEVVPGGSIALMTELDSTVVKSDKLVGSVVGYPGKLPKVLNELKLTTNLLERVVGAKDKLVVEPIKLKEILMLNVNSAATVGIVKDISKGKVVLTLRRPVCAQIGSRVTIARNLGQRWRLIGYGSIE
jgi:translation initiation factor 2 subunit 3